MSAALTYAVPGWLVDAFLALVLILVVLLLLGDRP